MIINIYRALTRLRIDADIPIAKRACTSTQGVKACPDHIITARKN
jgi:hypothetical protein